jgi:hypothetical protein
MPSTSPERSASRTSPHAAVAPRDHAHQRAEIRPGDLRQPHDAWRLCRAFDNRGDVGLAMQPVREQVHRAAGQHQQRHLPFAIMIDYRARGAVAAEAGDDIGQSLAVRQAFRAEIDPPHELKAVRAQHLAGIVDGGGIGRPAHAVGDQPEGAHGP